MQFDNGIGNAVNVFVSQNVVHSQKHSHSFYPVFADGFALTAEMTLVAVAFVIMILPALCTAGSALADHHTAAGAVEQLRGKYVFYTAFDRAGAFLFTAIRR